VPFTSEGNAAQNARGNKQKPFLSLNLYGCRLKDLFSLLLDAKAKINLFTFVLAEGSAAPDNLRGAV
jgi:hypothetical protein